VSTVVSELDEALRADEHQSQAAVDGVVQQARDLFVPPDPDTSFGARYLRALQDHPGVVLAHRDVVEALEGRSVEASE
jgi:hypothetical protein